MINDAGFCLQFLFSSHELRDLKTSDLLPSSHHGSNAFFPTVIRISCNMVLSAKIVIKRNSCCQSSLEAPVFLTLSKRPSLKPRYQGTGFRNVRSNRCDFQNLCQFLRHIQWPLSYRRLFPLSSQGTCSREHDSVSRLRCPLESLKLRKAHHSFVDFICFPAYTWTCFTLNPNLKLFSTQENTVSWVSFYSHNAVEEHWNMPTVSVGIPQGHL